MTNWEDPREAAIAFVSNLKPPPNASYVMQLECMLKDYYARGKGEGMKSNQNN